ncbi:MAG: hypothetical protein DYG89_03755 [Caldilinea sp. CFX5]|nr:hypothetical protein [Caldilinea sp. CFX5]
MTNLLVAGPTDSADWVEQVLWADPAGNAGQPLTLRLLPDAANQARTQAGLPPLFYYLPPTPLLAHDAAGAPVFSLALLLSDAPTPATTTIADLITGGDLAFDLTLGLPAATIQQLSADGTRLLQPLFARTAQFSVQSADSNAPPTTVSATGAGARASLSINLDQARARGVLYALQGVASGLMVTCEVDYLSAGANRRLRINMALAAVYDFFARTVAPGEEMSRAVCEQIFAELVAAQVLSIQLVAADGTPLPGGTGSQPPVDPQALLPTFLRFVVPILLRTTPMLASDDPANRYRLATMRPNDAQTVSFQQPLPGGGIRHITMSAPLEAILGNALAGQPVDQYIHLISPTGAPAPGINPLAAAPRRLDQGSRTRDAGPRVRQLAAFDGVIKSPTLALRPDSLAHPALPAMLTSDAVQVNAVAGNRLHWGVDDVVLARPDWWGELNQPTPQALPVVADPAAPLWPDRLHPNSYWYAPIFTVIQPAPNADPTTTPFLFTYTEQGHTASGRAGLNGVIRFTLQQGMSDQSRNALQAQNNPDAHPVALTDLAVWLDLPFRDETGATRSQRFPATVTQSGNTITATVNLLDDWVRLAYGALAVANFQSQPAQIGVAYSYHGYVLMTEEEVDKWELLGVHKLQYMPVVYTAEQREEVGNHPYLDAGQLALHTRVGAFHFIQEPLRVNSAEQPARAGNLALAAQPALASGALTAIHANPTLSATANLGATASNVALTQPLNQGTTIVAHPGLEASLLLGNILRQHRYATQTFGSTTTMPVLFPCNTLGAFYQHSNGNQQAIGCQDAFQLGQTSYHQYELITDADLQSPFYRVYRSLQQPGRFLVAPTAYRITRYAASEGDKAYRPVIYLYSTLDATNAANNRAVVIATLQPDLPPYVRRDLVGKLAARAYRPAIDYVTAIDSELSYTWSIGADPTLHLQPQAAKLWDGFQVSLSTDIDGAPQLQAMLQRNAVAANVTFTLPDGARLQTTLQLDLGNIIGPAAGGPLDVALQPHTVTLTNKIERAVNVSELAFYDTDGVRQSAPVDRTLAAGESCTVALPGEAVEAYPVYTLVPGDPATLAEVRSFVEDIHTNVVFLNLINYANHGLKTLAIVAQIKGVNDVYPAPISETQPIAAVDITLPLTTYLTNRVLQFQVTKTTTSDQVSVTPWLEWPLDTHGNVVSLTWEMIGD